MTAPGELLSIDADIPEAMEAGCRGNHWRFDQQKWGNFTNKPWFFFGILVADLWLSWLSLSC